MAKTARTYPPRTIPVWQAAQDVISAETNLATARDTNADARTVAQHEGFLASVRRALVMVTGSEAAAEAAVVARRAGEI